MMRQIVVTEDGSPTISVPEMKVTYHSIHGALGESLHVYIEAGLRYGWDILGWTDSLRIFEMGFGTGLNALLSLMETDKRGQAIHYMTAEPYPLDASLLPSLNYYDQLTRPDLKPIFEKLHSCEWENEVKITPFFRLLKNKVLLSDFITDTPINLIYFDAFAPNVQPELWTEKIFSGLFQMMAPGGILVTYSSKSDVRRALKATGFQVEKIPGPAFKKEVLRAFKP